MKVLPSMIMRCVFTVLIFGAIGILPVTAQNDYAVLNYWKYYSDAENSLYKQQCDIAFQQLEERKAKIRDLKSVEDWRGRQQEVRETFMQIVGPFPERADMKPVITGKVKREGFVVEKLYFESMPGVKVTAGFFIPDGKSRNLPTIIFCSGHSDLSFRSDVYQTMILNLVKKGFAVFAFDPFGQGERLQYLEKGSSKSKFSSTREHSYPGAQLFINGASAARYMIWDGIRSVDYLLTRKEVDPERIGITGRSGGGTQSSYIAAFDDRIKAAAPECFITSLEYLWKSNGPQDAEQNFFNGTMRSIDLADLLEVRAPKPALMITTTRDIFSIQGARETYQEVQEAYKAHGAPGDIEMVEDDNKHASTEKNREAMYAFFQKHLDNPGSSIDLQVDLFQPEELYVTESGQLETSIGSDFMFEINRDICNKNIQKLEGSRGNLQAHLSNIKEKIGAISGYEPVQDFGKLVFSGRTNYEFFDMEKYIVEVGSNNVLPFLVFVPKTSNDKSVLYLDAIEDKDSDEAYEIPLELAKKGFTVIVPDLPGYGELGPGYFKGDAYFNNTSYNQWFAGIITGKSTVAIHVESIEIILHHCQKMAVFQNKSLAGVSNGPFNSVLLHANSLGISFDEMALINPLLSFGSILSHKEYEPSFVPLTVAGSLQHYDLLDLVALAAPNRVIVYNAKDHTNEIVPMADAVKSLGFVKKQYASLNAEEDFSIVVNESRNLPGIELSNYLEILK